MRFDPEYVSCVLNENFEDAKAQFLAPLLAINYAHLVMLTDQQIVPRADARVIRDALDGINVAEVKQASYDGSCEDLFFYVERLIVGACGEDAAGRLHTARSRNDIDMTMYRMQQRGMILDLIGGTTGLRQVLIDLADAHREDQLPLRHPVHRHVDVVARARGVQASRGIVTAAADNQPFEVEKQIFVGAVVLDLAHVVDVDAVERPADRRRFLLADDALVREHDEVRVVDRHQRLEKLRLGVFEVFVEDDANVVGREFHATVSPG